MIVEIWKRKIHWEGNKSFFTGWFQRKGLPAACTVVPMATYPPECGSVETAALSIERQVEWKMSYVNLHWLRILLEHLGILIIKNKPRIFLHSKAMKRWMLICYSLRMASGSAQKKNIINITVSYLQIAAILWMWEEI